MSEEEIYGWRRKNLPLTSDAVAALHLMRMVTKRENGDIVTDAVNLVGTLRNDPDMASKVLDRYPEFTEILVKGSATP